MIARPPIHEESGTNTSAIHLSGVEVTYSNGVSALNSIDLSIDQSALTVLLGPSGAGKSTLLRTLNLLVQPTHGQVISNEFGKLSSVPEIRKHRLSCAMIFQQHQLIGRLSALQNVLTGRLGHHSFVRTLFPLPESERRLALRCLDRVGLLHKALTRCDELSGGQQQRVGIARALVQQPSMILADEPISSLDPAASNRVLGLLRDICREDGTTVVISLHQLEFAREYGDRIVGLSDGEVVFDDEPQQLNNKTTAQIYRHKF